MQITKLSDTLKDRQAQATKGKGQNIDCYAPVESNPQFKFSKLNGESDFNLMISQDQEKMLVQVQTENSQMREALRML